MSENKRFTYIEQFNGFCDVYDNGKILSCMRLEYVENTVNRLNELYDEIEQLKSVNMEYEDALGRLEEENEQLKSDLRYWRTLAQSLAKKNNVGDVE